MRFPSEFRSEPLEHMFDCTASVSAVEIRNDLFAKRSQMPPTTTGRLRLALYQKLSSAVFAVSWVIFQCPP